MLNLATRARGRAMRTGCTRGTATLEFAIAFPVLILMLLSSVDVANLVTDSRRLQTVANTVGQLVSTTSSGSVTYADLQSAASSAVVLFPAVLSQSYVGSEAWTSVISISISSIVFIKTNPLCTSNCSYTARVAWSGGSVPRPCGVNLAPASDSAAPSPTTLPQDVFGPGSLIVADVVYTYTPTFLTIASTTFRKSSFIAPRYVPASSYIKYAVVSGDNGYASSCPGY